MGIEYPKNLSTKTLTFYAHFSIFYFFLKTVLESAKNSESNSFFFKIFYKILLTELKTKKKQIFHEKDNFVPHEETIVSKISSI